MEMKRVFLLALLGHAATAEDGIECLKEGELCPDGFVCKADLTDRSGQRGVCTRPAQWAGDSCTYLIRESATHIDSCDSALSLICVSGELRQDYTCQPVTSVPYGGCLSTAASYMTQCSGEMVCVAFPHSRQSGQCLLPASKTGDRCRSLVISGPGYQSDSCSDEFECRNQHCALVSTDGSCGADANGAVCPKGQACDAGSCIEQPTPVYCNSDGNCRTNQICAMGVCKLASVDGKCNEDDQLPYAHQRYCSNGGFCMPGENGGESHCQTDKCYGICGVGLMCDNSLPACVEKQECVTASQDKCCIPTKAANAECKASVSECVCEFDDWCCNNSWDFQCVTEAQKFCAVTC